MPARPAARDPACHIPGARASSRLVLVEDRLPPARLLGQDLSVNVHTVLRAYAQLRDEGLVEMRRGRGVIVLGASDGRASLIELVVQLVTEARHLGLGRRELLALVEGQL